MSKKRDDSLDAVKGFAILIVMLGHCIVLNGLADPYFYDMIVAVQMPLFMVVSGFIVGRKPLQLNKKPDAATRLKQLGRRSVSYLVPFFVWLVLTHLTNPFRELKLQLFALDRGLWFLMTLWIVTVVTMAASYVADLAAWKCKGNAVIRFLLFGMIVGGFYLGFILQGRSGNTFLSPSLTVKYLPFYIVGYLWALYVMPVLSGGQNDSSPKEICGTCPEGNEKCVVANPKKNIKNIVTNLLWIPALGLFVWLVFAFDMVVASDTVTLLAQMAASFTGSFVCFYGIYCFPGGKIKKGLAFIGQFTLEIYVLHFRFARLLGIGQKELKVGSLESIGWIMAAFAVMSVLTAICIFIIKKIWILDLLLFGKRRAKK